MTIQLYDLTDASRTVFFSPYCWRIRMALTHKGLPFESIPWHFTDKALLEKTGQGRVPVIVDGDTWLHESSAIAGYLDATYPDRPALMPDAAARFVEAWCNASVLPAIRAIAIFHVFQAIHDKDKAYFRESREAALGTTLETLSRDPAAEQAALTAALGPAETLFATDNFFGGDTPTYADYVLFGTLMSPYQVCPTSPLEAGSAVARWFERMRDLHGGYARAAPRIHG